MTPHNNICEELIDIKELCHLLKVTPSYVYYLTHTKKIPYYKVHGHVRFRLSDIEEWLENAFVNVRGDTKNVDI